MKRQTSSAVKALMLLLCSLGFSGALVCAQVSDPIKAASTTPLQGATGGSGSYSPIFSADGRFIVFTSRANNLVTNDSNAIWLDVFVRDLTNASTRLVSVSSTGTGGGNGNSFNPSISSNGQFIAFESAATNLASGDTNGVNDVFVRDMIAGTTTLASVATNGVTSGNGVSRFPVMSADGSRVAFESTAADLTLDDTNSLQDVFVRDLQTATTILASRGAQTSTNYFVSPSLSADGQWVAYARVSVLLLSWPNRKGDVFVSDLTGSSTIWVSSNINNLALTVRSFNPALSADGGFVVFKSTLRTNAFSGSTPTHLYCYELHTNVTTVVGSNVWEESFPEITLNGRFVAYESRTNVFIWDRQTGSNTLVSVDVTGTNAASGASYRPVLTPDGAKIAFLSDASNITTNIGNGQPQIYVRDLFTGITRLVSVNMDGQPLTSMSGVIPAISADGNRVAFWSTDERIVPDDQNKDADVFVRDLNAGTTSLVSARDAGLPSHTIAGFLSLSGDSVGGDGRFVVLSALGSGLVGGVSNVLHVYARDLATGTNLPVDALENPDGLPVDPSNLPFPTNFTARFPVISANGRYAAYVGQISSEIPGVDQVYLRDLQSQTNWLVSRKWDGSGPGTAKSYAPSLSGDGRWLAFQSDAANLVPTDTNGKSDVFVCDVANATNFMVSLNRYGTNSANSFSINPVISRDGRWVLFQSQAADLVTNAFNPYPQLFARDLLSNTTTLVSKDGNGVGLTRDSGLPVINPGSTLVLFTNWNRLVFLHDLLALTNSLVCSNCYNPSMSADGRWVVVETLLRTNKIKDILLIDRQVDTTNLVSVNQSGTDGGNGSSTLPLITFDGRYIVFASQASDLVTNDNNGRPDIFIRDRIMNTTILASVNQQDAGSGNSASHKPFLGADGRTVVFQSFSDDLIADDFNNACDIFVLRLEAGDSDGDGMADDWELAYFGNLSRNGAGDFDDDGHTDYQEFLAGTDPGNTGSILRVMTITSIGGSTTILWSAAPGKNYRVQFKPGITDADWIDLPGLVTATGSSASRIDNSGGMGGQRFYRVVLAP